jgi:hypothetical protein
MAILANIYLDSTSSVSNECRKLTYCPVIAAIQNGVVCLLYSLLGLLMFAPEVD